MHTTRQWGQPYISVTQEWEREETKGKSVSNFFDALHESRKGGTAAGKQTENKNSSYSCLKEPLWFSYFHSNPQIYDDGWGKRSPTRRKNEIESQRSSSLLLPNDDGEDDFINTSDRREYCYRYKWTCTSGITLSLSSKVRRSLMLPKYRHRGCLKNHETPCFRRSLLLFILVSSR